MGAAGGRRHHDGHRTQRHDHRQQRAVVLLLLVVFISTNVAVLVLRRETVAHEHFRVWTFIAGAALYAAARRVRGRNGVAD